jgi:type IV secretory pathway VirB3-like protein
MSVASETGSLLVALARSATTLGVGVLVASGRRLAATVGAYVIVGLFLAVSLAFLTLSAYRAIIVSVGDVYAPLIVGCFYLVAGLVAALVAQMRRR